MSLQTPAASRDTTPEPSHKAPPPDLSQYTPEQIQAMLQKAGLTLPPAAGDGDETGNGPGGQSKTERLRQANAQAVKKQQEERPKASETISQDDNKGPDQSGKTSVKPTIESDSGSVKPTDQSGKASVKSTIESDSGSVQSSNGAHKDKAAINPKKPVKNLLTAAEFAFIQQHGRDYFPKINALSGEDAKHVVVALGSIFRLKDPERSVLELLCYADYTLSLIQDDSTDDTLEIIKEFAENPPAWEEIGWESALDAGVMNQRLKNAREHLNRFEMDTNSPEDQHLERSEIGTNSPEDQLSEGETLFLKEQLHEYFPNLHALPENQRDELTTARTLEFRRRHPTRDITEFLFFTEFALQTIKDPVAVVDAVNRFAANPPEWETIPWNGEVDQTAVSKGFKLMKLYRAGQRPSQTQQSPQDSNMTGYDSEERRKMRAKFHGQGDAEANVLTFPDPETGTAVTGEILGRHPQRPKWLAVALPGLEEKAFSRGYYVDCSNSEQRLALEAYITRGANKILSFATHKDQLDGCIPEEFELNLVLVMPWGKTFRYNAYGIPHYKLDRDFMVFSKSILTSSSEWGNATMGVLHGHMLKAGQTIPKARSQTSKPQGVKRGAWKH
ncbi:hypothetical protein NW759_016374 [Fusarium solani]|nr:hypothetical protein NW759_016374 [Fusarium solani]